MEELIKHYEKISKKLELRTELRLLYGCIAESYIAEHKNDDQPQNGGYTFWNNTVAICNPSRIGTLAHEMRHAYQFENNDSFEYVFSRETKSILNFMDLIEYLASRKERDANLFALKYLLLNTFKYDQIAEYLYKSVEGYVSLFLLKIIKLIKEL